MATYTETLRPQLEANAEKVRKTGPDKKAIEAYKAHVFRCVEENLPMDPQVLEAAWRIRTDFDKDCKTYRRRLEAVKKIQVDIPNQLAEIGKPKPKIELPQTGLTKLSTIKTIADLVAAMNAYQTEMQSVKKFINEHAVNPLLIRVELNGQRQESVMELRGSCNPDINRKIGDLQNQVSIVESNISHRGTITNCEREIEKQKPIVEKLARGERDYMNEDPRWRGRSTESIYQFERFKLEELLALRSQVSVAETANAADRVTIADLQAKIGNLELEKFVPRKMEWHE